jgi:hypothetical protein
MSAVIANASTLQPLDAPQATEPPPSAAGAKPENLVCERGKTLACQGVFGSTCYNPTTQSCKDGMICGSGERICMVGGRPVCYNPGNGQSCNN